MIYFEIYATRYYRKYMSVRWSVCTIRSVYIKCRTGGNLDEAQRQEKMICHNLAQEADTGKALNEICTNFVVEVGKQQMAHRDRQLELQKEQ